MAQLVAHLLCKQGVTGSSPVGSTTTIPRPAEVPGDRRFRSGTVGTAKSRPCVASSRLPFPSVEARGSRSPALNTPVPAPFCSVEARGSRFHPGEHRDRLLRA